MRRAGSPIGTATDDPSQETLDRRFWVAAADHDVEAMDAALEAGADIEGVPRSL